MGIHVPQTAMVGGQPIKLDWTLRHDERSLGYTVATKLNMNKKLRNRRWTKRVVLDQNIYRCPICKQFGACVGYSCLHVLLTTPRVMRVNGVLVPDPLALDKMAHKLYHGAQYHDQWSGQFESYEGSSVLGAMQFLKSIGAIPGYLWCRTLAEMQMAVSNYGPLNIGIDWDWNMFEPDSNGFIRTGGGEAGGHAIEVIGINLGLQAFELPNTWGADFGVGGSVWLPFVEMQKLIARRGEFALPRKFLLKRELIVP